MSGSAQKTSPFREGYDLEGLATRPKCRIFPEMS